MFEMSFAAFTGVFGVQGSSTTASYRAKVHVSFQPKESELTPKSLT